MANFDMPWEQDQQEPKVTPIVCGQPTNEEAEQAFDEMFRESEYYLNKLMKGIF